MSSSAESKKEGRKKYDRQLRIWDDHGQDAIEEGTVLLLNATATGSEILKNLVLPGFGSFHIVDNAKVQHTDCGNNFFVTKKDIGSSRAQVVTNLLLEMNPDVSGSCSEENPADLINDGLDTYKDYNVVVACDLDIDSVQKLASWCSENNVALLNAQANGLIGRIRMFLGEHTVVESKPDDFHPDLRLREPFPAFEEYVASFGDIQSLEHEHHREIPYAVLLKYFMDKYLEQNDGKYPKTSDEKDAFKAFFKEQAFDLFDEDNFQEGVKKAFYSWLPYEINSDVKKILADEKIGSVENEFWIMCTALKQFVDNEGEGKLPLNGSIPDMFASTTNYVALQTIYNQKAAQDIAVVQKYADEITSANNLPSIEAKVVKRYCKNSSFMMLLRYKSLSDEYSAEGFDGEGFNMQASMAEFLGKNIFWYAALRGMDAFQQKEGRLPGATDADKATLLECTQTWLKSVGADESVVPEDYVNELARYQGVELHNMAAMLGGVGAQEVLKIVTHQFVPFNHTLVINGIEGSSSTFNF